MANGDSPGTVTPGGSADGGPLPDLGPVTRAVALLASNVGDDRLAGPTPCPEYRVRHLLGHLLGLSTAFRDAARKDLGPTTGTAPGASLPDVDDDGTWRTRLPAALEELAAAWRDPAAWQGTTQAGGITLPAADAGRVALNEVTVHGWDLARATGQPYTPDTAALESSLALLGAFADGRPEDSPFGAAVPVAAGAPLLDRVVALSGRRPDWTP